MTQRDIQNVYKMLDNADIKHRVNEINSINDNNCEYYYHH